MFFETAAFALLAILSVTNIVSSQKKAIRVAHFTKPFLMPVLAAAYLFGAQKPEWAIAAALLCGFAGDVLLMGSGNLFAAGLAAFLAGHIFYISEFLKGFESHAVPAAFYLLFLPYLLYGAVLYKILLPGLKKMKIPALLYLFFILIMSFTSLMRVRYVGGAQFWLPFVGSLAFIASDSILSLDCFVPGSKNRDGVVMATYILGQTLIVCGFLV